MVGLPLEAPTHHLTLTRTANEITELHTKVCLPFRTTLVNPSLIFYSSFATSSPTQRCHHSLSHPRIVLIKNVEAHSYIPLLASLITPPAPQSLMAANLIQDLQPAMVYYLPNLNLTVSLLPFCQPLLPLPPQNPTILSPLIPSHSTIQPPHVNPLPFLTHPNWRPTSPRMLCRLVRLLIPPPPWRLTSPHWPTIQSFAVPAPGSGSSGFEPMISKAPE